MSKIVEGEGPIPAKILICGECPGETEEREGRPFCGMSGKVLDGVLQDIGLPRAMCRITNVVQTRPPKNDFTTLYTKTKGKTIPSPELLEAYERLRLEIVQCQPNVIVTLGNEALLAVTGKSGISHWRGSVLPTSMGKVIPAYHPAAVYRNWLLRPSMVSDLAKALEESQHPEYTYRQPIIAINPTFEEVMSHVQEASKAQEVAFDIETETNQITCIGLSYYDRAGAQRTICIPFWFGNSGSLWSLDEEGAILAALRGLLESSEPKKVAHNGLFDCEQLSRQLGIHVDLARDTMLEFHTLYPELPKALSYLISVYTKAPYHKDMGKTSDMDTYWTYNGLDAALTLQCAKSLSAELAEAGLESFYRTHVHSLIEPLLAMQLRGVAFDTEGRNRLRREYRFKVAGLKTKLEELIGRPLNVNSHKQMTQWLYTDLKLKEKTKRGEDSLTSNEEALREHIAHNEGSTKEALQIVLQIREAEKTLNTYLEMELDEDKRIRCSYNISGTETGRLSSSKSTRGTGGNLQNIPEGNVKRLFLADSGKVLINADLSQAEARIVAYLADERRLITVFESGGDIHRKNASNIYQVPEDQVTEDQRQIAKRVVHASNYGMGPRTFAKTAGVTESQAKSLLNQYFATYPRIKLWHMTLEAQLRKTRILTTPMGRRRIFFGQWGESVLKEGLAYLPQSTVADILNQALIYMHGKFILTRYHSGGMVNPELLLQVHDSVVVQVEKHSVEDTISTMRYCLSRPVRINGYEVVLPSDYKVGTNWGEMTKWQSK